MSRIDNLKGKGIKFPHQDPTRGGRPLSIKNEIKQLLEKEGAITIPEKNVISVNKDGSVTLKLPTKEQAALKIIQWAFKNTNKGADMLIKLQEIIDGKAKQEIEQKITEIKPIITKRIDD